jgi:phospholipase/carboxylesterase
MTIPTLDTFIIEPANPANVSIIWMHGLGASAHDFEDIVPQLHLKPNLAVRFVFPNAPTRPISINGNVPMPAWYDVYALDRLDQQDQVGIELSAGAIDLLVQKEIESGVPADRIILAGFSQGGAMALHTGLRYPERLAGIIALSCYLPLSDLLDNERAAANEHLPIFWAHGTQDLVVPMMMTEMGYNRVQKLGYNTEWHDYPMEHQICLEEIQDISAWINQVFVSS